MIDCDDIIDDLHRLTREQVGLTLIAEEPPVGAVHIDLAVFGVEQAEFAEWLCNELEVSSKSLQPASVQDHPPRTRSY